MYHVLQKCKYPLTFNDDHLATSDDLISYYTAELQNLLDSFASLKSSTVSFTPTAPWYTLELSQLKARGHCLESFYKRTGLTVHKEIYRQISICIRKLRLQLDLLTTIN